MVFTDRQHLMADSIEELHCFASIIGLNIKWYQNRRIPHYDIRGIMLRRALKNRAAVMTTKEMIQRWRTTHHIL